MARRSVLVESGGGLPVAPLIDVVFLLLIFFMLISRYLPPSLAVTLPEASQAALDTEPPVVVVSISRDGGLSVDGEVLDWDALAPRLMLVEDTTTQVRIAADREVDYSYVVSALDAAASAGLRRVALETQPAVR
jgi:biopolymer transport protein ExbD